MKFCRLVHWSTGKVFQSVSLVQVTFITGFALPDSCGQTESFRLRPITHHFVHRHKLHSHWHTHTHQHQHMVQVTFNTGSHSACDQLPTTSYIDTNYTLTNTHTHTHSHTHTNTNTWFKLPLAPLPLPPDLLLPMCVCVFGGEFLLNYWTDHHEIL